MLCGLLLICILLMSACTDGSTDTTADYRTEFTEDEMTNGHASFEIDKNLKVDADITKPEKYEKGLSSYYMNYNFECQKGKREEWKKEPTVFHKNAEQFEAWMGQMFSGTLDKKHFKPDLSMDKTISLETTYKTSASEYDVSVFWSSKDPGHNAGDAIYSPYLSLRRKGTKLNDFSSIVLQKYRNREMKLPSFINQADTDIKKYKKWIEQFVGLKMSEEQDIVPCTKELAEELRQEVPEKDSCVYTFYQDIEGLPYKNYYFSYKLKPDEKADPTAYIGSTDNVELCVAPMCTNEIMVDKDGIYEVFLQKMRFPGKVCQKKKSIVSPNAALKGIREYFDKMVILSPCTIEKIELVYIGYLYNNNGTVYPVLMPAWIVHVYDEKDESVQQYAFNAFNGDVCDGGE